MDALAIINKYYPEDNELKHILLTHSRSVADKALWIAGKHPELNLDKQFLEEAAMLHDIGIFMTDADGICCFGSYSYICHGYLLCHPSSVSFKILYHILTKSKEIPPSSGISHLLLFY